ncbi:unnamed protein product [Moneuplotes crassus]|uniref:Uncharacterized protein n=1 Tax=Euplotes crassus TaxID=5936 RepID=A0AAD2D4E2_EUPCR|nr:unnamed protein product [Moneuplotes crassus]
MSIKYAVIARDPDMPLCEYTADSSLPEKAKKSMREYLQEGINMQRNASTMDNFSELIACTLYDTILFACICDASINEDKAFRFLKDLKIEFAKVYKGHLEKVHEQQNIRPLCLDKYFRKTFIKILDNYSTGISSKNLQLAFAKAEEVKEIAQKNVKDMIKNVHETDELLQKSENINELAKDFEKNAHEMEKIQKNTNFWLCSKKCLIIFGVIILLIFIAYLILSFSVCGNMALLSGC